MLPSNLLRAKISKGKIRPVYVPLDEGTTALAQRIIGIYREGLGKKKEDLLSRLRDVENEGYDFKLVRGLSTLLERRCLFEAESGGLNPAEARRAVFREASKARASSEEETRRVLQKIAADLRISSPEALEKALFSDIEDELVLKEFQKPLPSTPETLLKLYNLSVTQTLLFKALRVEFSASGNWKNIFRRIKWLGLIYSVEKTGSVAADGSPNADDKKKQEQQQFRVSLDGPLSLFKMTERYGTSIAALLPEIMVSDSWNIKAEILARSKGGKLYNFEADSWELKELVAGTTTNLDGDGMGSQQEHRPSAVGLAYDSSTEQKFAKSFLSYGMDDWTLRREPEPLIAGTHVLIPDFVFEKGGMKVYLEVVGFWTQEYLERKIAKLNSISGVDMIIAADESLACSKLERLRGKALVIYYKKEVPMKPIIHHLKERDASVLKEEVRKLKENQSPNDNAVVAPSLIGDLKGDVISIEELANQKRVSVASMKMALQNFQPDDDGVYVRISDRLFISRTKLTEIDEKLTRGGVEKLSDAVALIEASGVKEEPGKVLEALGYTSVWEGLEMDKVKITKKKKDTGLDPCF